MQTYLKAVGVFLVLIAGLAGYLWFITVAPKWVGFVAAFAPLVCLLFAACFVAVREMERKKERARS